MKKVWIEPGCTTCGTCEFIAPQVFEVSDVCHMRAGADLVKNKEQIKEAAQVCPVNVIKHQE